MSSLKLTRDGKTVSSLTLDRGQVAQLDVVASDGLRTMLTTDDQFDFSVDGNIGTIDENGLFVAGNTLGQGTITVSSDISAMPAVTNINLSEQGQIVG